MSTTLIPPTRYEIRQSKGPARLLDTLADVAAALVRFPSERKAVLAVTGARQRRLNDVELRELARELRALRLLASQSESRSVRSWPA